MKKSVILFILVIYVAAICVVGFFGMKMRVYDQVVYPESLINRTEGLVFTRDSDDEEIRKLYTEDGQGIDYYYSKPFTPNITVELKFAISPTNATNQRIIFQDSTNGGFYTLTDNADGTAYLKFAKEGTVIIRAYSESGKASVSIRIDIIDFFA